MSTKEQKGIFIPKSTVWALLVTISIAIISTFTRFEVGFKQLEKEIEILRINTQKDINIMALKLTNEEELVKKVSDSFDQIQEQLHTIEKAIVLKQDKKFVE